MIDLGCILKFDFIIEFMLLNLILCKCQNYSLKRYNT